jgi:hypothetical protein
MLSQTKGNSISLREEQSAMYDFDRFMDTLGIGVINADDFSTDVLGKPNLFS